MNISKEEIIRAEEELSHALAHSDKAALERLLHDEMLFVSPNGSIFTKNAEPDTICFGNAATEPGGVYLEDLSLFGDTAIVMLRCQTTGITKTLYRHIRVWKRENGNMCVIGATCTRLGDAGNGS